MDLFAGTSGYAYKEWKGVFYPDDLPATGQLGYYAAQLPAVEINNTFYRMPKRTVVESWRDQVPEGFRFAIKASRRITHFKRLKDTGEATGFLLENTAALGERLGVLLLQLPPNLKADAERLDRFLELLPEGTPAAFEFRHQSWWDEAIFERLRGRTMGLVLSDTVEAPVEALVTTAPFAYLRLRRPDYTAADLEDWARRLQTAGLERAFVFFKHEDEGAGPKLAAAFLQAAAKASKRGPVKAASKQAAGKRKAG
jgi:uncharacterized protein YecE (DUF72 family)